MATLIRAARAGVSTEELLEQAARALLEVGRADRAGIWLVRNWGTETLAGPVVDALISPVPTSWCQARLASPVLGMLLHSKEPLVAENDPFAGTSELEALAGLQAAVWLPLRTAERLWGIAWAGYRNPVGPPGPQNLQSLIEQLVVLLDERALQEELRRFRAAAVALGELGQAVLADTPGAEIFARIVRAAVVHASARWAALARMNDTGLHIVCYHGPPECSVPLHFPELLAAAQRAGTDRTVVSVRLPDQPLPPSSIVAETVLLLPVHTPQATPHLLLAGFGVESPDETARAHLLVLAQLAARATHAESVESLTEAELLSVLDSVHAGILLTDLSGQIRHVNQRFVELLGVDPRQQPELHTLEGLAVAVRDRFRNPEEFTERWRQLRRDGEEANVDELEMVLPTHKVIERFARPVRDRAGRRLGWLEVYRDLTQQRLFQGQLVQTEKMAALGQLVSGIAHELNNPLTSIMGYAQLLLTRRLHEDRIADAEKIYQEAERARRLVKNLLLFARETKPERRLVDLNEIIERTLALRSYELKVENIQVTLELDPELPRTLADAHQLQQVILNLVVNAEQALQVARGSGNIWIRTRRAPGNRIALEVADDGPGIPPELASRIFDPFFTTKLLGLGTGLGLSIAYGIVQEHGGEITVESPPGQGATFVVELPVVTAAQPSPRAEPPPGPGRCVPPGRRILVVEDEPTVAQLVVDVLAEQGHQVEAVLDSREGLYRVSQQDYDLVICDLRMPRLDGRAFYEALVRSGSPARNRLFFITGDTLAPRTVEFLKAHRIPYLAKPFLVEELTLAVQRVLSESPTANPADRSAKATSAPARKS
ncbi:MAG: response regulator [Firmicutes bacterium]|nr:response regulator [Bacillota bacterium]